MALSPGTCYFFVYLNVIEATLDVTKMTHPDDRLNITMIADNNVYDDTDNNVYDDADVSRAF